MNPRIGRGLVVAMLSVLPLATGGCEPAGDARASLVAPQQAAALIAAEVGSGRLVILDVRTPAEFAQRRISGAVNLDYRDPEFPKRLESLDRSLIYLVYCRTGNRSAHAVGFMVTMGFTRTHDLAGGITLWEAEGFPVETDPLRPTP